MALKVGELYALFSLDTSGVTSALNGISTTLTSIGNDFIRAGTLWANAITVPLKRAFGDALETGMGFNAEMAKSVTKVGLDLDTEEGQAAYQQLRAEAFRVARQSVYTGEQVAGAYDKMAMAGWRWESMVGGLEPIMDLAAASAEDVVTVSDIVTDAMTAFGLTFENAGYDIDVFQGMVRHFTDVLSAAATSSNTDVGMMGESFKYAASMAGSMGYSIDDVAVALGLMANRGIKASQAGTALRRVLGNLVNPRGEDTVAAIDALGLSLHDGEGNMLSFMDLMLQFREKFNDIGVEFDDIETLNTLLNNFNYNEAVEAYDIALNDAMYLARLSYSSYLGTLAAGELPTKSLEDFQAEAENALDPEIVNDYEKAVEELARRVTDALSVEIPEALNMMQYASQIAGTRGLPALLAIITASEEEFNALTDAVYGSEGRTHAMKSSMLDNAQGDLQMLMSSVDILKISIEELVDDKLRSLLQATTEIIDKFISLDDESKETILKMAGIAAAIGPALVGIGSLIKLLPALGSALSFVASPIGLIAVALGALVVSALDADGKIGKTMDDIGKALGIENLDLQLGSFDITEALDNVLGGIGGLAANPAVQGFMERLGEGFKGAMSSLGNLIGDLIGYLLSPEGLSALWDAGISLGRLLLQAMGAALEGIYTLVTNLVQHALQGMGLWTDQKLLDEIDLGSAVRDAILSSVTNESGEIIYDSRNALAAIVYSIMSGEDYEKLFSDTPLRDGLAAAINHAVADNWKAIDSGQDLRNLFERVFSQNGYDFSDATQTLAEDFWELFYTAWKSPYGSEETKTFFQYLLTDLYGVPAVDQVAQEAAEQMKQDAIDAVASSGYGDAVSVMEEASQDALDAMEKVYADANAPIATKAAEISDEAVKKFLLTMSAENGKLIAESFISSLAAALGDPNALMSNAATSAGNAVVTAFSLVLSVENGNAIGLSFGAAIAEGIAMANIASAAMSISPVSFGGGSSSTRYASSGGASADQIAQAVRSGMAGVTVAIDGEKAGHLLTPYVSEEIAFQATTRS